MKKTVNKRFWLGIFVIALAALLAFATCSNDEGESMPGTQPTSGKPGGNNGNDGGTQNTPTDNSGRNGDTDGGVTSHIHQWGIWSVTTPATCVTEGIETRLCILDSAHKETRKIPIDQNAHDWEQLEGIAPTCTSEGHGTRICKTCGKTEKADILPIDPDAHDWGDIVITASTCTTIGEETRTCKHDSSHKETRPIAELGHSWGEWTVTMPITSIAAVEKTRTCSHDSTHKEINIIGSLLNYLYSLPINTAATAYNIKLNVSDLDNYTFYSGIGLDPQKYVYLDLSDSTFSIGVNAFYKCTSLTGVTIPNSVTSIGGSAFSDCTSLTSVIIPNSVTSIGGSAFSGCTSLTSVIIPNRVTSIGDRAFSYCTKLTSVTIPDSVTSIGYSAFSGCTSLTSVTIGSGVTSIISDNFDGCTSLTTINVDTTNAIYSSVDGILYNKNKTTLIRYPEGKTNSSFIIPDSVTSIESFAYCTNLTSVTIPNSVTSIGSFAYCTNLTSITIPDSVATIDARSFGSCFELTSVTFQGTIKNFSSAAFGYTGFSSEDVIGDLRDKYLAGGIGTYRRASGGKVWTKM